MIGTWGGTVVLIFALLLALAGEAEPPLKLICAGYVVTETESVTLHFLSKGGLSESARESSRRANSHLLFEMAEGSARLKLPAVAIPLLGSGGKDGWWAVNDLKITEESIKGWVRVTIIDRPSFTIDRTTGDIDVSGGTPFHGSCEKMTATERKF